MSERRRISIFGATGSIGFSTVDLLKMHAGRFDVQVVTGHSNVSALAQIAKEVNASHAVISDESKLAELKDLLSGEPVEVSGGRAALVEAASIPVDLSIMAIMGFAGLEPLFAALPHCKAMAIANKEPLVAAGGLFMQESKKHDVRILPLDSEHNAIYQVFEGHNRAAIKRIILTASGGPFLNWSLDDMRKATPEQALKHPNWVMGQKISIDSASMMNKALEVIEARYLFDMQADKIDVLIHPQSAVHSMVEYNDGSILSQMGASDMRTPIAYALGWPERIETSGDTLDLLGGDTTLTFMKPEGEKFPALSMAYEALRSGQSACVALNASNEVAVQAFLMKKIGFLDIIECTRDIQNSINQCDLRSLDDIIAFDSDIRMKTEQWINARF